MKTLKAIAILDYFGAEQMINNNTPFEEEDCVNAIEELEELQNRSCKNCKYCEVVFSYTYPLCVEDINKPFQIHNNEKLSCNRWESK